MEKAHEKNLECMCQEAQGPVVAHVLVRSFLVHNHHRADRHLFWKIFDILDAHD